MVHWLVMGICDVRLEDMSYAHNVINDSLS